MKIVDMKEGRSPHPWTIGVLKDRLPAELPWGQARVALGLICLPDDPVSYGLVADVFAIHINPGIST